MMFGLGGGPGGGSVPASKKASWPICVRPGRLGVEAGCVVIYHSMAITPNRYLF